MVSSTLYSILCVCNYQIITAKECERRRIWKNVVFPYFGVFTENP